MRKIHINSNLKRLFLSVHYWLFISLIFILAIFIFHNHLNHTNSTLTFVIIVLILIVLSLFVTIFILTSNLEPIDVGDDKVKSIIDTIPVALNIIEPKNLTIEYANKQCISLFGFETFEEYKGNFKKLFPEKQTNGKKSEKLSHFYNQEALEKGRSEFEWLHLNKDGEPIHCNIVLMRIYMGKEYKLITYIEDLRDQDAALIDDLTGAYNRRFLYQVFKKQLPYLEREKKKASFILLDIDHFKDINDTHGHLSGDEVLKTMAANIRTTLSLEHTFIRYGGEEFAVFLPDTDEKKAKEIATELKVIIANIPIYANGNLIKITCSFGVYTHDYGTNKEGTVEYSRYIDYADRALYEAKKTGRNKVVVYRPPK